jgi:hypothetical protein
MSETRSRSKGMSPEFWLLFLLLLALIILVLAVLIVPGIGQDATAIMDYRSNLLGVLLTAFGAWIGAGAAYFFGRENVREAYEGIKALQQPSPLERLSKVLVSEIQPRPIVWSMKRNSKINDVLSALKEKPEYWFIPVLTDDGKIDTVIEEEAVWRYVEEETGKAKDTDKISDVRKKIGDTTLEDLLKYVEGNKSLASFKDQYVLLGPDQNVYDAYQQMEQKGVKLAIVTGSEGTAKYFITTGDLRRTMAKLK